MRIFHTPQKLLWWFGTSVERPLQCGWSLLQLVHGLWGWVNANHIPWYSQKYPQKMAEVLVYPFWAPFWTSNPSPSQWRQGTFGPTMQRSILLLSHHLQQKDPTGWLNGDFTGISMGIWWWIFHGFMEWRLNGGKKMGFLGIIMGVSGDFMVISCDLTDLIAKIWIFRGITLG